MNKDVWRRVVGFALVLPSLIVALAAWEAIGRAQETAEKTISRELQTFRIELGQALMPEKVLSALLSHLLRTPRPTIDQTLVRLEKKYPKAFRWLLWDAVGNSLSHAGPALAGNRIWEKAIKRHFLPGNGDTDEDTTLARSPELRMLRTLFGKNSPVADLVRSPGKVFDVEYFDRPSLVMHLNLPGRQVPGRLSGILVVVDLHSLPDSFWILLGTRFFRRTQHGSTYHLTVLPMAEVLASSARVVSSPAPVSDSGTSRKANLFQALYQAQSEVFRDKDRLLCDVNPPFKRVLMERILVWRSIADTDRFFRHQRMALVTIGGLFVLLLLLIPHDPVLQALSRDSFPGKLAWYFIMALAFPLTVLFFLTNQTHFFERRNLSHKVHEHLRLVFDEMNGNLRGFAGQYETQILKKLESLLRGKPRENEVLAWLKHLIRRRAISGFLLSDYSGNIATFAHAFRTKKGADFFRTFLTAMYADSRQAVLHSPFPASLQIHSAGGFRYFKFGKTATYLLNINLQDEHGYRLLLVELSREALEQIFFRQEGRRANRHGPLAGVIPTSARLWRSNRLIPSDDWARGFLTAGLWRQYDFDREMAGVLEIAGRHEAYFVPTRTGFQHFRPIIVGSLDREWEKIDRRHAEITRTILSSVVSALFLGLFLGGTLVIPIRRLHAGITEFRNGHEVPVLEGGSGLEVGILNRNFNRMMAGLRERASMKRFLSSSALEAAATERSERMDTGTRRHCVVLFSHVHGFSEFLATHSPEEVFSLLNGIMAGFDRCVRSCGGEVDKFIDDGVMAVFPGEFQELQAVKAAWASRDFLQRLNAERLAEQRELIEVGIGINSGPAIIGSIGSARRRELTVIGDTVNTAARLESVSRHGRYSHIMISEAVYEVVRTDFCCVRTEITKVKGKQEALSIFEVIGPT